MTLTPEPVLRSSGWWPTLGTPIAIVLCLLGLATSGVLLQHHLSVAIGSNPLFSGFCGMTEHSSCDAVLRSPWAHSSAWGLLPRRPTAMWGFFFFAAMFSWYAVVGRPSSERKFWHLVPLLASAAATGICAGLAYLMFTKLPEWCPLCTTTHIITALLFVVTALMWPRPPRSPKALPAREPSGGFPIAAVETSHLNPMPAMAQVQGVSICSIIRPILIALMLAATIGWAGSNEFYKRLNEAAATDYKHRWQLYENDLQMVHNRYLAQPKVEISVGPDDSVRGPANAPHTVVMFGDLQCEYCRGVDKMIRQKEEENPGMMRVVFKHFPMNKQCNEYVKSRVHQAACAAAVTAEAARKLGGDEAFWKMHDELFSHQASFAKKPQQFLEEACPRLGLDKDKVWATIQTRSVWSRIALHTEQAHAIKIDVVPVVYLDGRRMDAWALSKFWDFMFSMDRARDKSLPPSRERPTTGPATGAAAPK